jgi:FKBP-type peptidyl-prolyl cis-trans isomerase
MKQDFYVYEHRRKDTGAVFYVGKGRKCRSSNKSNRGKYWSNVCKGAGGFTISYPVKGVDEELALLAEMELIDAYRKRGVSIVNISDGGEGTTGWVPTEETKRKIGEANKNTPKARGERHGMYGKKHSEESLVKMRKAQSTREWGERHPFYGKHHTEETRKKISESRKGKRCGADNPFYSKTHTPESIAKMSAASKGRKQSEETKAKRRDAFVQSDYFKQKKKPVLCLTNGVVYESRTEAARQLGLWSESVKMVCQGKLKSTGGHKFEWSTK